mmetsp:Transcript_74209/g.147032  ORF Transcript_74209/g.147032 Transcript_74209/m.147032 type:complete len:1075 (-) Transcript_74209:27-3251(-)
MAEPQKKKHNIRQYKGLVDNVVAIKESVERDRINAQLREKSLQERLKQGEAESQIIQKELSVQLRCAGRSYQQLLDATRDLTGQLRDEEVKRHGEREELQCQVKDLKDKLAIAAKPWKEEVFKRDLKILKLQEASTDQEARLREALSNLRKERELSQAEVKAREEKSETLLKEVDAMREQLKVQEREASDRLEAEKQRASREAAGLKIELKETKEAASIVADPYIKQVKELHLKVVGLERQLDAVDYTPYEKKVKLKEIGHERLIKDFGVKQKMNDQNIEKMRASFEDVIAKMDKQIQDNEKVYEAKLAPWKDKVVQRDDRIAQLEKLIAELRMEEAKARANAAAEKDELSKELEAARGGVDSLNQENTKLRRELSHIKEEFERGDNVWKKMQVLKMQLDDVTASCEKLVTAKDKELLEKGELVSKLQQRIVEQTEAANKADKDWDRKVQSKEEGYQLVVAQLAYAEGQILEERSRTAAALATAKKREDTISRLEADHLEELRVRQEDHNVLLACQQTLTIKLDDAHAQEARTREDYEARIDSLRRRGERRVADLHVQMAKLEREKAVVEKELAQVRQQFEKARSNWDDKERELEGTIRSLHRTITSLKNELEYINESWEIKYNRLMGIFEKLQKKYDELVGPGGVREAFSRVRDLKIENNELTKQIAELKEDIKKLQRKNRDLRLEINMHMKKTADLIHRKEMGMGELVGQNSKLETQLRQERELKETLVKELTEEKKDLVASFQMRVDQLEQLVESMRFTDRQELVDKIAVWKRAYERICIERDDLEDEWRQVVDVKDLQLKNIALEVSEVAAKVEEEKENGRIAKEEVENNWKLKHTQLSLEKMQVEKEVIKKQQEVDRAEIQVKKALFKVDARIEDPEKDGMRQKIKEQDAQIVAVQAGVQQFIQDNTALLQENEELKAKMNSAQEDWEPQIRWRDQRYAAMMTEHEALKEVLATEMKRAQDTCKEVEEQVRRFPNPFEDEINELKERYAQTQAGMLKISRDNLALKEELLDHKEEAARERDHLEDVLAMATHILKEVAGLGALKDLSSTRMAALETALGVDLDGDGAVG